MRDQLGVASVDARPQRTRARVNTVFSNHVFRNISYNSRNLTTMLTFTNTLCRLCVALLLRFLGYVA